MLCLLRQALRLLLLAVFTMFEVVSLPRIEFDFLIVLPLDDDDVEVSGFADFAFCTNHTF